MRQPVKPPQTRYGPGGIAQAKPAAAPRGVAPPPTKFGLPSAQRQAAAAAGARSIGYAPPPTRYGGNAAQPKTAQAAGGVRRPASVIQPMYINEHSIKKPVPPTGKFAKELASQLSIRLLDSGISPYGIKSNFFDPFIREDLQFDTGEEAMDYMVDEILDQKTIDDKKKKKNKKYRRKVHVFKLSRPTWPKNYRTLLGAVSGDDIRHIVRNATLKRAIDAEVDFVKHNIDNPTQYFYAMALELKLKKETQHHYLIYSKKIYEHLYLNIGNLFAGPGGVNQSIGFAADPIANVAKRLEADPAAQIQIEDLTDEIYEEFAKTLRQIKSKAKKQSGHFTSDFSGYEQNIHSFMGNIFIYWMDTYAYCEDDDNTVFYVDAGDVVDDVYDISDNLGLDLITITGTQGAVERHAKLVEVETALKTGAYRKGTHDLTNIFKIFMSAANWV